MLLLLIIQVTLAQEAKNQDLSNFVGKLYVDGKIHGGVILANGEEIIYKDGWGVARKASNSALDGSEMFSINSKGKMFTSVLTLQLVDEGIISLDDKLDALYEDFHHPRASEISLHDLLAHRSGIQDYFLLRLSGKLPFDLSKNEMLSEVEKIDQSLIQAQSSIIAILDRFSLVS